MRTPERCPTSASLLAVPCFCSSSLQCPDPTQPHPFSGAELSGNSQGICPPFLSSVSFWVFLPPKGSQTANNSSGVIQVVERDKNASVVSGSHQPTMKQKRVDDTAPAGLVQLSPHHLLLLSITLLSDQSSSAFIPLCLSVGQKRDLPEHGTGSF